MIRTHLPVVVMDGWRCMNKMCVQLLLVNIDLCGIVICNDICVAFSQVKRNIKGLFTLRGCLLVIEYY